MIATNSLHRFGSFDFFFSLEYWLVFACLLIMYRLLSRKSGVSLAMLLVANLGMILALPRLTLSGLAVLLSFASVSYLAGRGLNSRIGNQGRTMRFLLAAGAIVAALLVLAAFKYRGVQRLLLGHVGTRAPEATDFIFLVGISYTSFRLIHFVAEGYAGRLERVSPLVFFNYVFFFPGFVSGPINRYNEFANQFGTGRPDGQNERAGADPSEGGSHQAQGPARLVPESVSTGLYRIVHGIFKKVVVAALIYPYTLSATAHETAHSVWPLILAIYAQTLYFYIDFSGYSDIAIGTAQLLGIRLPENFRSPFLKPNIQQLWANWHISLTSWLTDYVYWPLARLLRRAPRLQRRPILLSNIAIIVTFAVCGLWHGEGLNFLLWGLYHGIGIAILNLYRAKKRRVRAPWLLAYYGSRLSGVIGIAATFTFFAAGIVLFSLNLNQITRLVAGLY